jgi:oxalate decarboxylase
MGLAPGALRELHWHANAAEWGYVQAGRVRCTILDPRGQGEVLDFDPGDVWYFPRGYPHSIQCLGPDDTRFVLIFDNGYFSENETFSISDWFAHTPARVLEKNLGLPPDLSASFPQKEVYMARGPLPGRLPSDPPPGLSRGGQTYRYRLLAQEPRRFPGGDIRMVGAAEFPISTTLTGALLNLEPAGLREMHWHPNCDEWFLVLEGRLEMTLFASLGTARTETFEAGDVGFAPQGYGHYLENTGQGRAQVLLGFNTGSYQEISASAWLAATPRQVLATNFGVPEESFRHIPGQEVFITR